MKCFYPSELFAATLNSYRGNIGQSSRYMDAAKNMGITILPPSVNESYAKFTTEGEGAIRIGLALIKNVGEGAVKDLENERAKNGKFKAFEDFLIRGAKFGLKRNTAESLVLASCLDWTGLTRSTMIATIRAELDKLASSNNSQVEGQLSLFDMGSSMSSSTSVRILNTEEYSKDELLALEKEMIGIYLSGHPLEKYRNYIDKLTNFNVRMFQIAVEEDDIDSMDDGTLVVMAGIVQGKKLRTTKSKNSMATLALEDLYGQYEAVMFGKVFEENNFRVNPNQSYILVGKRRVRGDDKVSLTIDRVFNMPSNDEEARLILGDRLYNFAIKTYGNSGYYNAGAKAQVAAPVPEAAPSNDVEQLLTIEYNGNPSEEQFQRLLNFLAFFHGSIPVDVKFIADGSTMRLHSMCNVNASPEVLERLNKLEGVKTTKITQ